MSATSLKILQVEIPNTQHKALKQLALDKDTTVSDLVRPLLARLVSKHTKSMEQSA